MSDQSITEVGPFELLRNQFPQAEIRDFGEAAILPGLVNLHTHLELSVFRGRLETIDFQPWISELVRLKNECLTEEDLRWSARLGCIESLRCGITTVADTAEADAVLPALIESGQRGVVFQECFGPNSAQAPESVSSLKCKLDSHLSRLESSDRATQNRLSIGISPHAPYTVSGELYRRVGELAGELGMDLALHSAESAAEAELLQRGTGVFADALQRRGIEWVTPGCSMIKYLDQLGVLVRGPLLIHCVSVDSEDLEMMAENGARMAHCPKSNAKFGHGVAPLGKALQAGIRVGLGTDSVASNNKCDLIEEARFALLAHRGQRGREEGDLDLDAGRMLRLMTIDGARSLGLDGSIGSLEAGKLADLIVMDLSKTHNLPHYDPSSAVIFSSGTRDCVFTMVAGRVLYDGDQVATIDEQETVAKVGLIATKLRC